MELDATILDAHERANKRTLDEAGLAETGAEGQPSQPASSLVHLPQPPVGASLPKPPPRPQQPGVWPRRPSNTQKELKKEPARLVFARSFEGEKELKQELAYIAQRNSTFCPVRATPAESKPVTVVYCHVDKVPASIDLTTGESPQATNQKGMRVHTSSIHTIAWTIHQMMIANGAGMTVHLCCQHEVADYLTLDGAERDNVRGILLESRIRHPTDSDLAALLQGLSTSMQDSYLKPVAVCELPTKYTLKVLCMMSDRNVDLIESRAHLGMLLATGTKLNGNLYTVKAAELDPDPGQPLSVIKAIYAEACDKSVKCTNLSCGKFHLFPAGRCASLARLARNACVHCSVALTCSAHPAPCRATPLSTGRPGSTAPSSWATRTAAPASARSTSPAGSGSSSGTMMWSRRWSRRRSSRRPRPPPPTTPRPGRTRASRPTPALRALPRSSSGSEPASAVDASPATRQHSWWRRQPLVRPHFKTDAFLVFFCAEKDFFCAEKTKMAAEDGSTAGHRGAPLTFPRHRDWPTTHWAHRTMPTVRNDTTRTHAKRATQRSDAIVETRAATSRAPLIAIGALLLAGLCQRWTASPCRRSQASAASVARCSSRTAPTSHRPRPAVRQCRRGRAARAISSAYARSMPLARCISAISQWPESLLSLCTGKTPPKPSRPDRSDSTTRTSRPNIWCAGGIMGRPTPRRAGSGWTQPRKSRRVSQRRAKPGWCRPRPLRHGTRKGWTLLQMRIRVACLRTIADEVRRRAAVQEDKLPDKQPAEHQTPIAPQAAQHHTWAEAWPTKPKAARVTRRVLMAVSLILVLLAAATHWQQSLTAVVHVGANPPPPFSGVRVGEASNPGPPTHAPPRNGITSPRVSDAHAPVLSKPPTGLRIATANVGGIANKDGVRATQVLELATRGGYDVLLLQETNCIQQKATADILGPDWHVYHDPSPRNTGRGVAIAVRRTSCPELTNIQRGADMREPAAAGRLITGDLVYATRDGRTQTIELTSFHVGFSERDETLQALGEHLDCRATTANPARAGVIRIVGGDGNGVWDSSEVTWASDPERIPTPGDQGLDFKACMAARKELMNQKPPGSFPDAPFTHEQKDCRKRIDYIFANRDLTQHVHHSRPEDENGVRTGQAEDNSLHHWVVADLPAEALGNALRPLDRATYNPHRIHVNLANSKELAKLLEAATPAATAWEANLPQNVAAAFLAAGALDATSTNAQWAACAAALPEALRQVRELAVESMQRALGQPEPAKGRGCRPGHRIRNPIAPPAAQHRRAEVWLTKAARVARRVLTVGTAQKLPPYWAHERAQLERRWATCAFALDTIAAAGWHPTARCQPGLGLPTLAGQGAQPSHQQRLPSIEQLFTATPRALAAWSQELWVCKTKQTALFQAAQGKVALERRRQLNSKIADELFHHGTGHARKLLAGRREDAHSHGMAMLRDPRTQKVVVHPRHLEKIAVAHTHELLGTSPPQPPTGKHWQQEAIWTPLKQRWTPAAREAATALATTADIHKIITKAKTGGAPGLDGIQYGVLKLLLRTGSGALLTVLTNITNTVLRSASLPEALGKSEIVYFYKKGDPADMGNYRGISLQSVLYKLAAAFTAAQLQSAAEALDLLSAAQVAARKGGRAADHVATMAAAIAHAHRTGQELHLLTCDIAKAFDEAPRAALLEALERHGYPAELIRRVQLLQTCTGARVRTRYGVSEAQVVTTRGCKQGCPLSPIVYCLFTNMLLKGLQNSPIPGYAITPSRPGAKHGASDTAPGAEAEAAESPDGQPPAPDAEATTPTLDHQGYLDDLALFASSAAASTSQLAYANDFLRAYGMRFNTSKCRHSVANPASGDGARVTLNTGWSPATPSGTAVGETIPQTQKGGTFEYLGHHLTTDGDWTAQELRMVAKLTRAMHAVSIASGKGACGLLWTVRLAEHDAVSTLTYYMGTTALCASTLEKALTALVRPVWSKGSIESHHVACLAAVGSPATLKGLGLTHPEALDKAEKASTLLRLLNTPSPHGIGALAEDGWRALARSNGPSQAYPKTAKHTLIPATHTGGMAALRMAPAGESAWTIAENYREFAATRMGDLCPALKHALGPAAAAQGVRAFLALTAGEALTIAKPRQIATVPPCWRAYAPISISEAEEIAFAGKATRRHTTPDGLLTPHAQRTLRALRDTDALLSLLATELTALLTGPLAFTFITRPGLLHLLHAAKHGPHTGTALPPALASEHVGVDGSYKVQPDGRKLAAGAVCYYTREAGTGLTEARLLTCTFEGEQTSAHAEMSSMSLALQTLSWADNLHIGWDLKPGVDTMHAALAQTRPMVGTQAQPPAAVAPMDATTATYYAHNPHMHRAVALARRDLAAGRRRQVIHQAAHSQQGQDESVAAILASTPGTSVRIDTRRQEYVVQPAALAALDRFFASWPGAPQAGTASHTRLVQNALADWAAKRVTVQGKCANIHLTPNTLSHTRWVVVDERGAIQQSDNSSLRRSVIARVSRALVEARAARSPYLQTKLNLPALWASESTHALTLRSAGARHQTVAPTNEHRTRFCAQMLYQSCHYAKDATEHTPALADVEIDGNTLDLTCPLCGADDSDTTHHLFHECTATRAELDKMHQAIAVAIRTASAGAISAPMAADIASAATSRPDFFAGQIPKRAQELLLAARRASTGASGRAGEPCAIPQQGAIQQLILKHCKAVHETRKQAVDAAIKAADAHTPKLTSSRDVHAYRHALWGTARHAARVEASQQQQQQAGRSQPPQQAAHRPPRQLAPAPQWVGGLAASLNAQYAPLGMIDADVPGDGNCLLYAALGLSVGACASGDAQLLASRINQLRAHVIQHARGLSIQLKRTLGIFRTGAALGDLRGAPTTVGQPARWSLDYQAGAGHFMTDNVMHSLAATLDSDIVVIRTDATGRIRATLDHFHARAWALARSREPDGGPTMEAYSTVLWAGGQLEAAGPSAGQHGRQTRAASRRQPSQLTLRQLLAQRLAEQRRVTLIYSNGGDYESGHFRAVVQRTGAHR